jgi:hypothetical protein
MQEALCFDEIRPFGVLHLVYYWSLLPTMLFKAVSSFQARVTWKWQLLHR